MTLYQLSNEYMQLLEMLQDPEIDQEVIKDTMEAIDGEIEVKAENYVILIKELESCVEKIDVELNRLSKWKSSCISNISNMKKRLMESMEATGKTKLPTEHFNISIAKNGGVQPMYVTPEIADIPEEFLIRKPTPDNAKIRKALAEGKELSFAHLEERGTHLSIR